MESLRERQSHRHIFSASDFRLRREACSSRFMPPTDSMLDGVTLDNVDIVLVLCIRFIVLATLPLSSTAK